MRCPYCFMDAFEQCEICLKWVCYLHINDNICILCDTYRDKNEFLER